MTNNTSKIKISDSSLLKQFGLALLVAVTLWLTIVLPAEYQIDPLSTGEILGLNELSADNLGLDDTPVQIKDDLSSFRLSLANKPLKTLTKQITIEGYEGIELKAIMEKGDGFTFQWSSQGGPLYVDMHGEYLTNLDEFESYFKEQSLDRNQGTFVAPFAGTHGWYWQNMQEDAITVTLSISGFYSELQIKQEE